MSIDAVPPMKTAEVKRVAWKVKRSWPGYAARIYLDLPAIDRPLAEARGAKFDAATQRWYTDDDHLVRFLQWIKTDCLVTTKVKAAAKDIRAHWDKVGALPCMVTGRKPVTLHHAHGGSMRYVGVHKAGGMKTSDWLVLPICAELHTGRLGIDGPNGVPAWEARFGTQVEMLDELSLILGYSVWARAGIERW